MALSVGEHAPEFELKNQHGQLIRSREVLTQEALLVVFLPLAFSATSTEEITVLQREKQRFTTAGLALVVVSVDSTASLRAWADQGGYELELLSDFWPHGATARAFDVFDEDRGFAARATFLIDRAGIVRAVFEAPLGEGRAFSDYEHAIFLMQQES